MSPPRARIAVKTANSELNNEIMTPAIPLRKFEIEDVIEGDILKVLVGCAEIHTWCSCFYTCSAPPMRVMLCDQNATDRRHTHGATE